MKWQRHVSYLTISSAGFSEADSSTFYSIAILFSVGGAACFILTTLVSISRVLGFVLFTANFLMSSGADGLEAANRYL